MIGYAARAACWSPGRDSPFDQRLERLSEYSVPYVLEPAMEWKDFGAIDVHIHAPDGWQLATSLTVSEPPRTRLEGWRRRNETGAEIEEEGCVFALVDVGFAAVFALLALPVGIFAFEFFALDSHQHPTWTYRVGTFLVTLGPLLALLSAVIVAWSRRWSNSAA